MCFGLSVSPDPGLGLVLQQGRKQSSSPVNSSSLKEEDKDCELLCIGLGEGKETPHYSSDPCLNPPHVSVESPSCKCEPLSVFRGSK